ncbi:MAG: adenylate/guanylate cyclase domain-containing protein [Leptolyngbyaceae cyanobacterium SL_7_1]|nr:adenylate/guanylate cyclase domain-containing protein [Leptolyngbyaceae cyanobacterium SL_7_1]
MTLLRSFLEVRDRAKVPETKAYTLWRRKFLFRRLRFSIYIALIAYLTFITLRVGLAFVGVEAWDVSWLTMALTIQLGLWLCLGLTRTAIGHRYPQLIFLGCSWSITLIEQVWATYRGEAFPGVYAWTLVFLAQATLMPVLWQWHLVAQVGVLLYYFGVNSFLGLQQNQQSVWDVSLWLYIFWFCCICNLSVFLYERLQQAEFHARLALESEQRKSERLLLNILPEAVAQQLKQEQRTIAEHFPEVTVLFADIVGFTQLSTGVPPEEMVQLLNHIFSTFDHLAERHQLEKIKTIGDAYMVVGGLPIERHDHVEAIADMALDMQQAIAQFNRQSHQSFSMRMGIHTGPVVAGVIGVKKFIYDLWGDTVNVASRMESHGIAGEIQVTTEVFNRLNPHYEFEERGAIAVKGKGDMTTYLLRGRRNQPTT